ncbi:MAG: protein kinase domain-containing protein [Pseudonocardia sp.]
MNAPVEESPTRIGNRYRLEERIAAGAMGAVWRGTDELLNRTVALKELLAVAVEPTAAGADALEESRQRILREGRIGARLQHPHVISMFDVVVHDDRPWLVMEYLPSRSLAAVLTERGPMDPLEAAEVGRQVADGLAAAHAAGVVHRDIKPGNVLLADDGRVKLTDFGVSRAVDDVQLTRTGMIAGTPAFLSPEVARGNDPTAAADVFALGATLYAAVEGHPPFGLDDNAYALLHKVATGDVRPPERGGPLTALLMRLLSTDPADRPNAIQARDTLAAISAGQPGPRPGPVRGGPATAVFGATRVQDRVPAPVPDRGSGPNRGSVPDRGSAPNRGSVPDRGSAPDRGHGPDRDFGPATVAAMPMARRLAAVRRRTPIVVAVSALLFVVAGILGWVLLSDPAGSQDVPPVAQPTTSAPVSPSPQTSPTPQPGPQPPPAVSGPVAFVQRYYALLPEDTDTAFAMLSPAAQQASGGGGKSSYDAFYARMESVSLEDVRAVGANTVEARVVFDERDGPTTAENYRFVMSTGTDGVMIMASFSTF